MELPPFWNQLNWLSEKASEITGLDNESVPFNMGCGFGGALLIAVPISELVMRKTPDRYQKYLPKIFNTLEKITLAAPFIYAALDPHAKEYAQNNPVYMYGVGAGVLTASQVFSYYNYKAKNKIDKMEEQKSLDSLFNK